jgi:hypothetical protein
MVVKDETNTKAKYILFLHLFYIGLYFYILITEAKASMQTKRISFEFFLTHLRWLMDFRRWAALLIFIM